MKGIGKSGDVNAQMAAFREMLEEVGTSSGRKAGDGDDDAPEGVTRQSAAPSPAPVHRIEQVDDAIRLTVEVPGLGSMQGVGLDVAEKFVSLKFPEDTGL